MPSKAVSYTDSTDPETIYWIQAQQPDRIFIVDFGDRADSLAHLITAVTADLPNTRVSVLGIGSPATAIESPAELEVFAKLSQISERVQMNTSSVREDLIERYGAEYVFGELDEA